MQEFFTLLLPGMAAKNREFESVSMLWSVL